MKKVALSIIKTAEAHLLYTNSTLGKKQRERKRAKNLPFSSNLSISCLRAEWRTGAGSGTRLKSKSNERYLLTFDLLGLQFFTYQSNWRAFQNKHWPIFTLPGFCWTGWLWSLTPCPQPHSDEPCGNLNGSAACSSAQCREAGRADLAKLSFRSLSPAPLWAGTHRHCTHRLQVTPRCSQGAWFTVDEPEVLECCPGP